MVRQITTTLVLATAIIAGLCGRVNSEELSREGSTIPKEGFVPTADVAITIAEAVLVPVYGKDVIHSERPFHAALKGDLWIVSGTVPCEGAPRGAVCPGGNAEVRISKKTGRIVYMMHSM
jgi:hypothetical protein